LVTKTVGRGWDPGDAQITDGAAGTPTAARSVLGGGGAYGTKDKPVQEGRKALWMPGPQTGGFAPMGPQYICGKGWKKSKTSFVAVSGGKKKNYSGEF